LTHTVGSANAIAVFSYASVSLLVFSVVVIPSYFSDEQNSLNITLTDSYM